MSVIDTILHSINTHSQSAPSHRPLSTTAPGGLAALDPVKAKEVKQLLMTLHFFFPHELLPALDLLDRGLLTCLSHRPSFGPGPDATSVCRANEAKGESSELEVWYIQSASAVSSSTNTRGGGRSGGKGRYRDAMKATNIHYEVRLDSWNCSCAAFAFSTFQQVSMHEQRKEEVTSMDQQEEGDRGGVDDARETTCAFGGIATMKGMAAPVCKHILAALLAKAVAGLFGGHVTRKEVSREELAGWGAGWGDC